MRCSRAGTHAAPSLRMHRFISPLFTSFALAGALWLTAPTPVHAQDAGMGDGGVADAGPPQRSERTGLPPLGCSVAGASASFGPALAMLSLGALARRRRRR